MDLDFNADDLAFRDEVRRFISDQLPDDIRRKVVQSQRLTRDDYLRWQRILHARGWGAPSWPAEHGGPGWSAAQRHLFDEECNALGAPGQIGFGLKMVAPVIMRFGRPEQQRRYLPRIADGTDWWCQGYSEPGAGSDLASLRTKAVRDGDHYIVNGHKTWTTLAQHADWIFCLVRTDPHAKAQSGISFLLIDMKSSGVVVRPIITLEGRHEINDVFLEDVRVPVENLIGEENKGWTYAKFLLGNERTSMAGIGRSTRYIERLKKIVKAEIPEDDPAHF